MTRIAGRRERNSIVKLHLRFLTACLLSSGLFSTMATAATPAREDCLSRMSPDGHDDQRAEYVIRHYNTAQGPGAITLVGVPHFRFIGEGAVSRLSDVVTASFTTALPDIAYFEGTGNGSAEDAATSTRRWGEPGLLRYLGRLTGIQTRSLELPMPQLVHGLLEKFPQRQVVAFYVARQLAQPGASTLAARIAAKGEERVFEEARDQMEAASAIIDDGFGYQEFLTLLRTEYAIQTMMMIDRSWFDPRIKENLEPKLFNKINRLENMLRNRYIANTIDSDLDSGKHVFVLIGRDHVYQLDGYFNCTGRTSPAHI